MPVREGLPPSDRGEPREEPPPSRVFHDDDGLAWTVEVAGRGRTGSRGDRGADLLLLTFRPGAEASGEEPGEEPGEEEGQALERLVVARELDDLSDDRLVEILAEASPPSFEPGELFPGTRRGRGGS